MKALWDAEARMTRCIWGRRFGLYGKQLRSPEGWQVFFMRVIPVPPSRFRPPILMDGKQFEHAQNFQYTKILNLNEQLVEAGVGDNWDEAH